MPSLKAKWNDGNAFGMKSKYSDKLSAISTFVHPSKIMNHYLKM